MGNMGSNGEAPTFRVAGVEDASTVANMNMRLAKETEDIDLDRDTVNAGVLAVLQDKSKGTYFLAQVDGKVVAQLMITYEWSDWRNSQMWWIQSVFVLEEYRQRGYFKALFNFVHQEGVKAGACGLRLYADVGNAPALKTYERLGMTSHYKVYEKMFT